MPLPRPLSRKKATCFTIGVLAVLMAVTELVSFVGSVLADGWVSRNPHNPYAWTLRNSANRVGLFFQDQRRKNILDRDPLFGQRNAPYVALNAQDNVDGLPYGKLFTDGNGFVKNETAGESALVAGKDFLVVVSGGSSVAGLGVATNEETFPAQLERWLRANAESKDGRPIRVLNAGVPGYNASQELTLFQYDLATLRPAIWVQLSGINEAWKFGKMRGTTELHYHRSFLGFRGRDIGVRFDYFPATQKFFRFWLPLAVMGWEPALGDRRSYGEGTVANKLFETVRMGRAVAGAVGSKYLFYLQPTLAAGKKAPTEAERAFLFATLKAQFWASYLRWSNEFYSEMRAHIAEDAEGNLRDISGIFDRHTGEIYYDPRHYLAEGNRLIAERIGRDILAAGFLRQKRAPKVVPFPSDAPAATGF